MNKMCRHNISYKRVFSLVIISSFIAWLIAIICEPQSRQIEIFFDNMGDFLADATNTTGLAHDRNPYLDDTIGLQNAAYPPLAYFLFYWLALASGYVPKEYLDYYKNPMWLFLFIVVLTVCFLLLYTLIIKRTGGTKDIDNVLLGIAICVSYPILHTVERGNIIFVVLIAIMIYLFYYDSESKIKKEIALLSLAFAAGIKLSPAIFGFLLIYRKDWKAAVRAVSYGILMFILPFFFFKGGIENLLQLLYNVELHSKLVDAQDGTTLENIFEYWRNAGVKFLTGDSAKWAVFLKVLSYVKLLVCFLFVLSGFIIKDEFKRVLNITLVLLILPTVSMKYCIIYLFPAIVMFLTDIDKQTKRSVPDIMIFIATILLNFVYRIPHSYSINFKSVSLLIFIFAAILYSISEIRKYVEKRVGDRKING